MSLYDDLGVEKGAEASSDEIKKAFREKSKEHHPDKGGDAAKFHAITRAYRVLGDEAKRARYDKGEPAETIENEGPSVERLAREVIMAIYGSLLDEADLTHDDLIGRTRTTLRELNQASEKELVAARKAVARLEQALKRLKCKGERNFLAAITEQKREAQQALIARKERDLKVGAHALSMLAEFEYAFARRPDTVSITVGQMRAGTFSRDFGGW